MSDDPSGSEESTEPTEEPTESSSAGGLVPAAQTTPVKKQATTPAAHSAAASVLGYLHQTRWGLLELLRAKGDNPDLSLTLEMHDDVAWEDAGTPTELKQMKLHVKALKDLTDSSDDMWRTLGVWLDNGRPRDVHGPVLTLVTNSSAAEGSAASMLRPDAATRDPAAAAGLLAAVAAKSTNKETKKARDKFLELSPAERMVFVERIYVADESADLDDVDEEVATRLRPGAPTQHFDTYLDQVWGWWGRTSLAMLRGRTERITVAGMRTALERVRDQFASENLPVLVQADEIDLEAALQQHEDRTFVHQLKWVKVQPRQLQKAILDYQVAYLQETRWLAEHLVDYDELERFTAKLIDEWEREFDFMCGELGEEASEEEKRSAGRSLLHTLSNSTLAIRARFDDATHARGRRHALADGPDLGWHPDFQTHLEQLLLEHA